MLATQRSFLASLKIVSEAEARRNQQREANRKAANKATRERVEAEARAAIEASRAVAVQATKPDAETKVPATLPAPFTPRVVYVPTPEEAEEFRAEMVRREDARLAAHRLSEAKKAKLELLRQAEESKPAINVFVGWVIGAGFTYSHDDRNAAVYTCEGVEIKMFGAAMSPDESRRSSGWVNKNLNSEQLAAKRRREQQALTRTTPKTVTPASRRENNRALRLAAQPPKGPSGQKDTHGHGKAGKKGGKK